MTSTGPQAARRWTAASSQTQESLISMTDLFGRKWCPVVLYRLLRDGPMGFSELKHDIDGVSGKMLAEGLETLETRFDLVERSVVSERPFRVAYAPTDRAESLDPLLQEMHAWSAQYMDETEASTGPVEESTSPSADRDERDPVSVEPEVDDVLSVAFDLSTPDLRVYRALLGRPKATTHELAEAVGIDRSNVNRSLGRLRERDLVDRRRRLLQEGGHCYVYTATEIDEARELLHEGIDAWAERAHDELCGALVDGD